MARYTDNSSLGWKILSLFLTLILIAGVITGVVFWQKGNIQFIPVGQEQQEKPPEEKNDENGGAVIEEGKAHGMKLMSARIAPEDYAANGISPLAETAYTLTATIKPENATDKAVDWSVEFVNPESDWANDKTVTDYVTVTPTADGALTATVECKAAFGEQIKVIVISRVNMARLPTEIIRCLLRLFSVPVISVFPLSALFGNDSLRSCLFLYPNKYKTATEGRHK